MMMPHPRFWKQAAKNRYGILQKNEFYHLEESAVNPLFEEMAGTYTEIYGYLMPSLMPQEQKLAFRAEYFILI